MATYIFQVSLCWLGFYLIYRLLLSNVTYFQLNRWFLLLTLFLGLVIPLIDPFPEVTAEGSALVASYLEPITISADLQVSALSVDKNHLTQWSWQTLLQRIYLAGVVLALFHFLYGLISLIRLYLSAEVTQAHGFVMARTRQVHLPFSFFNILFWSRQHSVSPEDERQIIRHELAHIRGWHSLDVLFLELLSIVMWCSPLVYLYRRSLRTTHEYLADAAVLQTIRPKDYGHLLIRQSQSGPQIALANHFIHSQLKKRFMMMKKRKSKRQVLSRYLLLVPMMFLMTFLFSKNYHAAEAESADLLTIESVMGEVDQMPRFPGCETVADAKERKLCSTKKLFIFMNENLKYPEAAKKAGVEGRIVLSFMVEADGSLSNIKVLEDIGSGCGAAAVAVAEAMPKWIPGKKDGKAVAVKMKLPFIFKLEAPKPTDRAGAEAEVDQYPIFPTCADQEGTYEELAVCSKEALVKYIFGNLKYPKEAKEAKVEGMVVTSFVVDADGKVRDAKIEKSLHPSCDQKVLDIIESTNELDRPWGAGKKADKAVATVLTLPVRFKLPAEKELPAATLKVSDFNAAPNPSNGVISVQFEAAAKPTRIQVLDLNGRAVFEQNLPSFDGAYNQQIDLQNAAKGTLILQISQGDQVFSKKVLLQ